MRCSLALPRHCPEATKLSRGGVGELLKSLRFLRLLLYEQRITLSSVLPVFTGLPRRGLLGNSLAGGCTLLSDRTEPERMGHVLVHRRFSVEVSCAISPTYESANSYLTG